MDHYGLQICNIDNLDTISDNKRAHYIYDGFHFLADLAPSKNNLVVFFHGAIKYTKQRPIFRGIEYRGKLNNSDILSLSDKMQDIFPIEDSAFYLSHDTLDHFSVYKFIIKSVIDKKQYNKIIFTSSSAGSIAALVFASVFKKTCLILNPYMVSNTKWYSEHISSLNIIHNDMDIGTDIYKFMDTYGYPESCIYYQNSNDKWLNNKFTLPFQKYIEDKKQFELRIFEGIHGPLKDNQTHHNIITPPGETLAGIINGLLEV